MRRKPKSIKESWLVVSDVPCEITDAVNGVITVEYDRPVKGKLDIKCDEETQRVNIRIEE